MLRKKDMRSLLLVAQGHHGIDTHRPARRHIAGDQHYSNEQCRDAYKSCGVGCRYAERSEEHTSELQSRLHLVCRLLLEKKTSQQNIIPCFALVRTCDDVRP